MSPTEETSPWKKPARLAIKLVITVLTLVYAARSIEWPALGNAWRTQEPTVAAIALLLLGANLWITSARFGQVLRAFRFEVPSSELFRTHIYSQLSGLVFFQIVGQTISRAVMLRRFHVDETSAVVASLVERVIVMVVSFGLCVAGAVGILGMMTPEIDARLTAYGGKTVVVLLSALFAGALFAFPAYAAGWASSLLVTVRMRHLALAGGTAVVAQLLVAFCYVLIAKSAAPETATTTLLAAALVVMFAASIPISIGGWGVRELSAVWVFRQAGLPDEVALMTAIAIGAMSLLVVIAPLPLLAVLPRRNGNQEAASAARPATSGDSHAAWVSSIPLAAAALILFQIKVPASGRDIVISLADPVALLAGLFCLWQLARRRSLPAWSSPYLNTALGAFTAVLTIALIIGITAFGPTPWAINNRYAGWIILLAYMLAGSLAFGLDPTRRLFTAVARTLLVVAATISLAEIALLMMKSVGVISPDSPLIGYNIEGFSLNRNAFAFQLLITAGLAAASIDKTENRRLLFVSLSLIIAAAILSGSRAAWLALPLMAGIAFYRRLVTMRELVNLAVAIAVVVMLPHFLGLALDTGENPARLMIQRPYSDDERMAGNVQAIAMWLEGPILGSGLGAFIHGWAATHGTPLVIHNIYLWLLAETGSIGLAVLLALFWTAYRHRDDDDSERQRRVAMLLVLSCLALTGLFHDMLYQRVFWFAFGALASAPASWRRSRSARLDNR